MNIETFIEYKTINWKDFSKNSSHSFNKHILLSYDNISKYGITQKNNYLLIKKQKIDYILCNNNRNIKKEEIFQFFRKKSGVKKIIISEEEFSNEIRNEFKNFKFSEILEMEYDAKKVFSKTTKLIRQGIRFSERKEIQIKVNEEIPISDKELVYKDWVNWKLKNPKLFRMAFSPERYRRSFLYNNLLKYKEIKEYAYYVNGEIFALRVFSIDKENKKVFDCAFMCRMNKKELIFVSDISNYISINSFYKVFCDTNCEIMNSGRIAGKSLSNFKKHIPFFSYKKLYQLKLGL